ncbi:M56 family metallopeptidase [Ancylomarina sp. YFZ004]
MLIFITYMIKVGISLAFFYVLYKLLLNKDANHKYKRLTLLLSVCAAFAMPLLAHLIPANEISSAPIQKVRELIEMPLLETAVISPNQKQPLVETPKSKPINWTAIVYLSILSLLSIHFLLSYRSILKWLRKATIKPYKDILLAIVSDAIQAFSFLNYIVLSKQDYKQNKTAILLHEEAHIRLYHSFDVILIELVCYLQWFNPFAWLLKKELKLVHEFQADQAVLNTGIDATQYQLLILEKAVGKRRFAVANHFKQGSISKRLKMMKKKQVKRWGVAKALLFIPMGLLLLQAFTQPEIIKKVNTLPPLMVQADSSQIWLSQWTAKNLPKSNQVVTKLANMAEKGTESVESKIKKRNVLRIMQNRADDYLINDEITSKNEILAIVKSFIQGKDYWGKTGPEVKEMSFGGKNKAQISKGVVVYEFDKGTSKGALDFTMKAIGKAHLQVRKEKAINFFNKAYFDLKGSERSFIDKIVPIRVMKLPSHNTSGLSMNLKVTKDGIFFNDELCPLDQLADRMKLFFKKNPKAVVQLSAKKDIKKEIMTVLIKQLRLSGVSTLTYLVEKS